jgi:hypothetical protein
MKRVLLSAAGLAMVGLAGMIVVNQGQAQVGPGNQPAVLRTFMDPAPANPTVGPTVGAFSPGMPAFPGNVPQLPDFQPKPDPNQDLFVTPAQGPWLICVNCYSGPESPPVAREMVMELRQRYKLPAFVFSKGDEERRAEFERIKKIVEDYHKLCLEKNLTPDPHMRVKTRRIESEYAVLVGNYPDADAARRDLERIRKLDFHSLDPKLCPLGLVPELDNPDPFKVDKKKIVNTKQMSPFANAFVVHNPAIKQQQRPADWDKLDMAVLKNLNSAENYSLLNCKKQYTLIVKQFPLPAETRSMKDGTLLGKINPFAHKSDIDIPGQNAHKMAELLHKVTRLDAFVLHTKYASMVTVGAFDRLDDPALLATQEMLRNQYKIPLPVPMAVPR